MLAWSCRPVLKALVLVSNCNMLPHCREEKGGPETHCLEWIAVVVYRGLVRIE